MSTLFCCFIIIIIIINIIIIIIFISIIKTFNPKACEWPNSIYLFFKKKVLQAFVFKKSLKLLTKVLHNLDVDDSRIDCLLNHSYHNEKVVYGLLKFLRAISRVCLAIHYIQNYK